MRRRSSPSAVSIFEEAEPQVDRSSEFDKHMSQQTVPRMEQGGTLYNLVCTESFNDREERLMRSRGGNWMDKMKFDDQTGPGGSNFVPGSMCCDDSDSY